MPREKAHRLLYKLIAPILYKLTAPILYKLTAPYYTSLPHHTFQAYRTVLNRPNAVTETDEGPLFHKSDRSAHGVTWADMRRAASSAVGGMVLKEASVEKT